MFTIAYSDDHLTLGSWDCRDPHEGWSDPEPTHRFEIAVALRGCLVRECRGEIVATTSNVALLANPGDAVRFRHPRGEPDRCALVLLDEVAMQDLARASGERGDRFCSGSATLTSSTFLRFRWLMHRASRIWCHDVDPVRAKEAVGTVAAAIADGPLPGPAAGRTPAARARHTRAVERALAYMAAEYDQPLTLDAIAREAAYSPFHFARLFRARTGLSVHRYLTRLRLNAAVAALLDGEEDLGALALRLGFASHSHFTDAFRIEYGLTPSALRQSRFHS